MLQDTSFHIKIHYEPRATRIGTFGSGFFPLEETTAHFLTKIVNDEDRMQTQARFTFRSHRLTQSKLNGKPAIASILLTNRAAT